MTLTEPQVWVLMGVFATAIFGMLSWQTISFNRNLSAVADRLEAKIDGRVDGLRGELGTLHGELGGLRGELKADIAELRTELKGDIAELRTELKGDIATLRTELKGDIATLSSRIDVLDRDVQTLSRHVFGTDPR